MADIRETRMTKKLPNSERVYNLIRVINIQANK